MTDFLLLLVAGFLGGMLNAVAGGGTFIVFPALVFTGVPVVSANATSTVAALPGYLAAALGFRHEIARIPRDIMMRLTLWTLLGGGLGSALLLVSSNEAFAVIVPFLLLAATLIFLAGPQLRAFASRHRSGVTAFGAGTMVPVALYGGYFNGGLGIVLLALFSLWGMTDIHTMNGLKTWLSFALSTISLGIFAWGGQIAWLPCLILAIGAIIGGLAGAPVARLMPVSALRGLIAVVGFGMTALFFWRLINGA
ncbi:sulfite exporter TauE/SafE family protein [Paracoccus sp. (in: a-proteobacteria)]|uniref:sulfite exporter TauE/SafE family protein n=1 Tax=Paracoccus sp. TaxID=267 RepID=UPI0026E0188F|nr:sulfite exporter TauE/SafE family protein [Paracoccus sp. (in: a-proteobacteria)]MDO5369082.1 sulfite exporter TauE/SafE family protein [Paracoccus sp. (in: a-proteobacteria)]